MSVHVAMTNTEVDSPPSMSTAALANALSVAQHHSGGCMHGLL